MKAAAIALLVIVTSVSAALAQTSTVPGAVVYRERPEGGPQAATGRVIPSSGGVVVHGLDINSGVEVNIDPDKLVQALAASNVGTLTPQQKQLLDHIIMLKNLMAEIDVAAKEEAAVVQLFHTGTIEEFRAARSQTSGRIRRLRETLRGVIAARLVLEGATPDAADRRAKADVNLLGLGSNDWPDLRRLVSRELEAVQRAYNATTPNLGVALELRAHLIPKQGDAVAIPLPGHNTVQPGPVSHFEKITFVIPAEQQKIFDEFTKLAANTGEAKDVGQALLLALRSDVAMSPIQEQLDKVKADADQVKTLVNAIDSKSIDAFLKSVKDAAVAKKPDDAQVVSDVTALVNEAKSVKSTLTALTNVGAFTTNLKAAADPVAALQDILGQFRAAAGVPALLGGVEGTLKNLTADVTKLRSSVNAAALTPAIKGLLLSDSSPVAPLLKEDGALPTLIADTKRLGEMVVTFFHADTTANSVADLPVPQGQKRIPVEQNASTSFNLQTIPAPRHPGDNVRLSYAFFSGDQPAPSVAFADMFDLRLYGLSDRVAASLAFVRQISEAKFKPTAAMSWLLRYQPWPKAADERRQTATTIFSGAGLTTMSLDFDPNETVEIGVAPTLSFLNDRILIGYGWNLQAAKNRTFAFFSISLLSRPGFLGNGAQSGQK